MTLHKNSLRRKRLDADTVASRELVLKRDFPTIWADPVARKAALKATVAGWHPDHPAAGGLAGAPAGRP